MAIENFYSAEWRELLLKLHQQMIEENALYEELADNQEMSEGDIDEFFEYHRTKGNG